MNKQAIRRIEQITDIAMRIRRLKYKSMTPARRSATMARYINRYLELSNFDINGVYIYDGMYGTVSFSDDMCVLYVSRANYYHATGKSIDGAGIYIPIGDFTMIDRLAKVDS